MRSVVALRVYAFAVLGAAALLTRSPPEPWLAPVWPLVGFVVASGPLALLLIAPGLEVSARPSAAWARAALLVASALALLLPVARIVSAPTLADALSSPRLSETIGLLLALAVATPIVAREWRVVVADDWPRLAVCALVLAAPAPLDQTWLFGPLLGATQVTAFCLAFNEVAGARRAWPIAAALVAASIVGCAALLLPAMPPRATLLGLVFALAVTPTLAAR